MVSERPRKPARITGRWPALALAVAVHAAFLAVLVFSLRWQNRVPAPVMAELYSPPARAPAAEPPPAEPSPPPPKSEPPPPPRPEPKPEPKAQPRPEPKAEKPDARAADIAQKAKADEERRKREQAQKAKQERESREREKKEAERRETEKKKQEEQQRQAEARERQKREAESLKAQAEREQATRAAQQKAEAEASARARAEADYIRRIQAKVKGNVVLPPDMQGNPEAVFEVVQLPTGEIIDAVLRKSSGVRAYDDAVQRAIAKSSPLPRPERPDLFQRTLTLKFRPQD